MAGGIPGEVRLQSLGLRSQHPWMHRDVCDLLHVLKITNPFVFPAGIHANKTSYNPLVEESYIMQLYFYSISFFQCPSIIDDAVDWLSLVTLPFRKNHTVHFHFIVALLRYERGIVTLELLKRCFHCMGSLLETCPSHIAMGPGWIDARPNVERRHWSARRTYCSSFIYLLMASSDYLCIL